MNTAKIATTHPECFLRFATTDDIPTILTFIEALADYERLAHAVVATEQTLRATLFPPLPARGFAEVVLAFWNDEAVGFALFFHNYSTFLAKPGLYLEDLFVLPTARGHGIGKILFEYLAHLATERGCGRMEWAVLDWNEPAIGFYQKLGATAMDTWTTFRLEPPTTTRKSQTFDTNEG